MSYILDRSWCSCVSDYDHDLDHANKIAANCHTRDCDKRGGMYK